MFSVVTVVARRGPPNTKVPTEMRDLNVVKNSPNSARVCHMPP